MKWLKQKKITNLKQNLNQRIRKKIEKLSSHMIFGFWWLITSIPYFNGTKAYSILIMPRPLPFLLHCLFFFQGKKIQSQMINN